ncbi:MAG: PLP-dependent aminotransferase family protein [Acidobacteriota bacterium]
MSYWDTFDIGGEEPKYLAICEALAQAIASGQLGPGRRLPSHRLLARKLGVSVGTVTRAYAEALRRGLISGEVGRGSYVSHTHLALSVVDSDRIPTACVDLYQNLPVRLPELENEAWAASLSTLRAEHDLEALVRWSWSEVTERNRRLGVRWIERLGMSPAPESIVDCPGVLAALNAIFAATLRPGATVLTSTLVHPALKLITEHHSLKLIGVPGDDEGLLPEALAEHARRHSAELVYCMSTLHSPTTATMSPQRREAIAEVVEREGLILVEDEHAAFLLPEPALPISSLVPEHAFLIADLWMALSLGLWMSFVRVPDARRDAMARAVAASSGTTPAFTAELAARWIESDLADRLIAARRAELEWRNALTRKMLGRFDLRCHPQGHHVWLELGRDWRSQAFTARCLERRVAVNGSSFFRVEGAMGGEGARLSIGNATDRDTLEQALEQVVDVLQQGPPEE